MIVPSYNFSLEAFDRVVSAAREVASDCGFTLVTLPTIWPSPGATERRAARRHRGSLEVRWENHDSASPAVLVDDPTRLLAWLLFSGDRSVNAGSGFWYCAHTYRNETPPRPREFMQVGCEVYGDDRVDADAVVITAAMDTLARLQVTEAELRIGHVGIAEALLGHFGVPAADQPSFMRALDDGTWRTLPPLAALERHAASELDAFFGGPIELRRLREVLTEERHLGHLAQLSELCRLLDDQRLPHAVRLSTTRDGGYYTGLTFEIHAPSLGAESQICGGGRYDSLVQEETGRPITGSGFAIGVNRVASLLDDTGR